MTDTSQIVEEDLEHVEEHAGGDHRAGAAVRGALPRAARKHLDGLRLVHGLVHAQHS